MRLISDLHVHSRFARATSNELNIPNLEKWAKVKGLGLIGTGDFTHPEWNQELKRDLKEDGTGILKTENNFPFVLQTEVSLMYSQGNKGRRVHLVLLAPSFEIVDQIIDYFAKKGRLDYDGRPIFGLNAIEVTESLKSISDQIEIIPAHIWTPWFGLLGSKSGFNSFEEAFEDQVKHIYSLETGLSSDPPMNWRLSQLDKYSILSFSDLHSFWPWRIGRESTIFELPELTYKNLINAIRTKQGLAGTIEVDPGYGKYHFDGHRFCKFSCSPQDSKKRNNTCPRCNKQLTIGVLNRVEELADREEGFKPENPKPFHSLLPLHELISLVLETSISTQKVWKEYNHLIMKFGNEFDILLNTPEEQLIKVVSEKITSTIIKNREGKIKVKPGYDGEYGKAMLEEQKTLF
ncbi:MAG: DNA helicase UvrD [archaeon]|nr:MAG: DNA helicase UvrD [archaeon]